MLIKSLNNKGKILNLDETKNLKSGLVILMPGEEIGKHITKDKEEAIVILSGQATVELEGEKSQIVDANFLVYIPQNKEHNIKNNSNGILRYLYLVSLINNE